MKLNDFLSVFAFQSLSGGKYDVAYLYEKEYFYIPRIYCKDGFNISVQVHKGSYCGSENGIRKFGTDWKLVEWGFPSEEIDAEKYCCESDTTKNSVGGYVDILDVEGLLNEHGGIDLERTFEEQQKFIVQSVTNTMYSNE